MPLTPEDVSNKRFTPVRLREGYDMGEVDQFLDEVEAELARLTRDNNDLRAKVASAQGGGPSTAGTVRKGRAGDTSEETGKRAPVVPEPAPAAAKAEPAPAEPTPSTPAETIQIHTVADASGAAVRLLEIATRNADELVTEAKNDAERIVVDARTSAEKVESDARTRSEALDSETEERRKELIGELDKEKEKLNVEVEALRSFEREYRSRLKSYFSQQLAALDGDGEAGELSANDSQPTRMDALRGDQQQSQTR
ncbi:MAG TPA: DivIVA domain-containing protein [Nocardioidaceae bacterium]|nr:DivIVA domain-containing protein [Nocardioidaceae bacterium]